MRRYISAMIFAYGYNRTRAELAHIEADRVFIDTAKTRRAELTRLIREHLRRGHDDKVVLISPGDIRAGTQRQAINDMGVEIWIDAQPKEAKAPGPIPKIDPERRDEIKTIWLDRTLMTWAAVEQANKVNSVPLDRHNLYDAFGPRGLRR